MRIEAARSSGSLPSAGASEPLFLPGQGSVSWSVGLIESDVLSYCTVEGSDEAVRFVEQWANDLSQRRPETIGSKPGSTGSGEDLGSPELASDHGVPKTGRETK